jgi:hypothetical protein
VKRLQSAAKRLLVLVMLEKRQHVADLYEIGREILRQASDITIHIVSARDSADVVPAVKWRLPALTVSFSRLRNFIPPRGRTFTPNPVKKLDQFARFTACAIDTPGTARFEFGKVYDEAHWGEFCVLKPLPLQLSSKGRAMLIRTRRLDKIGPADFPSDHFIREAPALVQRFIDTGRFPAYHRVMTLFGEPLLWWRGFSPLERPPLSAPDAVIEAAIIEPKDMFIRDNFHVKQRREWDVTPDVTAFARRMHEAYPAIPLKGCDILKEESTGRLYAIEINGGGNVWHFSSELFARSRNQMGGRDAMVRHYDPWPKAARILIEMTREHAV